jgi:hypothetical protein
MPSLLINDEKIKDVEKVDVFSSFCLSIAENLNSHQVGKKRSYFFFKRFISLQIP